MSEMCIRFLYDSVICCDLSGYLQHLSVSCNRMYHCKNAVEISLSELTFHTSNWISCHLFFENVLGSTFNFFSLALLSYWGSRESREIYSQDKLAYCERMKKTYQIVFDREKSIPFLWTLFFYLFFFKVDYSQRQIKFCFLGVFFVIFLQLCH